MTSHSCTTERERERKESGIAVTYPNPGWCKEAEANINERLQARYIFMVPTPQLRHYGHQRNVVNHQPALWLHLCLFLSLSLSHFLSILVPSAHIFFVPLLASQRSSSSFHVHPRPPSVSLSLVSNRLRDLHPPPEVACLRGGTSVAEQSSRRVAFTRATSGLWRHGLQPSRTLGLRHFIDCDHKTFYTPACSVCLLLSLSSFAAGVFLDRATTRGRPRHSANSFERSRL